MGYRFVFAIVLLSGAAGAQDCQNAMNPVKEGWVWTYRSTYTNAKGQVQRQEWQEQTKLSATGYDRIKQVGKESSRMPNRCEVGAQTSLAVPSIADVQVTKASVTGFSVASRENWQIGKTWNLTWDIEGKKGILRGTGEFSTDYRVLSREKVSVPAGDFEAYKVEVAMKLSGRAVGVALKHNEAPFYFWYAEGVGLIKQDWGKGNVVELVRLQKG